MPDQLAYYDFLYFRIESLVSYTQHGHDNICRKYLVDINRKLKLIQRIQKQLDFFPSSPNVR